MNIYFSCSITGGREDEDVYQAIVDTLLADGHEVPTAILASSEVVAMEDLADPVDGSSCLSVHTSFVTSNFKQWYFHFLPKIYCSSLSLLPLSLI